MRRLLSRVCESVLSEKDLLKELKLMAERLEGLDRNPDQDLSKDEVKNIFGKYLTLTGKIILFLMLCFSFQIEIFIVNIIQNLSDHIEGILSCMKNAFLETIYKNVKSHTNFGLLYSFSFRLLLFVGLGDCFWSLTLNYVVSQYFLQESWSWNSTWTLIVPLQFHKPQPHAQLDLIVQGDE